MVLICLCTSTAQDTDKCYSILFLLSIATQYKPDHTTKVTPPRSVHTYKVIQSVSKVGYKMSNPTALFKLPW